LAICWVPLYVDGRMVRVGNFAAVVVVVAVLEETMMDDEISLWGLKVPD
jgi:hypothetical protein